MSYFTALKLEREPFSTSPDPSFFYHSVEHTTALNRLEIAIRLRRGLSLVLGDVGTGKTTLSRALFQAFAGEEDEYIFHMILDPSFKSEYQFLVHLSKLFGISPFFRSTVDHLEAIERYLFQKTVEEQKTVVLVIDESQKMLDGNLEILRTLLNYETNEYKMLQLVILGQMELLPRIKSVHNFVDRISMKFIINPLDERETAAMIRFRLKEAGYHQDQELFTSEAMHRIHEYTRGYPRQIALMCHNAIEHLVMRDCDVVTESIIDRVIEQDKLWR